MASYSSQRVLANASCGDLTCTLPQAVHRCLSIFVAGFAALPPTRTAQTVTKSRLAIVSIPSRNDTITDRQCSLTRSHFLSRPVMHASHSKTGCFEGGTAALGHRQKRIMSKFAKHCSM